MSRPLVYVSTASHDTDLTRAPEAEPMVVALAQAMLAKEQQKTIQCERQAEEDEEPAERQEAVRQAVLRKPWYREPTLGAAIATARQAREDGRESGE